MTAMTGSELGAVGRFVDLGSPVGQDDIGAQTVIAYVKMSAAQAAPNRLMCKSTSAGTNGMRFVVLGDGGFSFAADSSGSATFPSAQTAAGTVDITGTWQHLQATWDGTINAGPGNIQLFKDASANLNSGATAGVGTINSDAANSVFLLNRPGLDRSFVGSVAYIARWNRILSGAEMTTVRADGPGAVPSGLIMLWANQQDFGPQALTPVSRSAFVDGGVPTNTAIGDASSGLTGNMPAEDAGMTGSTGPASILSGNMPAEDAGLTGSTGPALGTFTSEELYNNLEVLQASKALNFVALYHDTTNALIIKRTGLSTNASGIVSFSDATLTIGAIVRPDIETVDGIRIMPRKAIT